MPTTGGTGKFLDLHERSDRVDGESEIPDWVEWERCGWWRAWEERAGWIDLWRRSGAEVVEDKRHMLGVPC